MKAELAEEASNLRVRLGFKDAGWIRSMPVYLLVIGVFGIWLPWEKGRDFLDSVILGAYACLGVVFAAPAAASPFDDVPTSGRAIARVTISVLYGELIAVAMLILGIATVYVSRGGRVAVGPDLQSLAECAAFGLTLSLAVSTIAAGLSVNVSPRAAKTGVRLVFLGLLAAFYFRSGWLPSVALRAAGIALLVFVLSLLALRASLTTGGENGQ